MSEWITAWLLATGAIVMLLAALGVLRMPDVYMRMQATTKASTLGIGSLLLAVAVYFGETALVTRALLGIAFVFLTTPISAHLIGRAAYFTGVPLWEGTLVDELREQRDAEGGASPIPPESS